VDFAGFFRYRADPERAELDVDVGDIRITLQLGLDIIRLFTERLLLDGGNVEIRADFSGSLQGELGARSGAVADTKDGFIKPFA
jgi:hypothetical protein